MSEKRNRKASAESKSDYYTPIIIGQFFLCLILSIVLYLFFSFGGAFAAKTSQRLLSLLSDDESLSQATQRVMAFIEDSAFEPAVSGQTVTDADFYGSGGEDIELYEAAEKTSFAPFVTTDTLLSPIEKGRYTSLFGYRIHPVTGQWSFHTGIDIAAGEGTSIRATLKGRVTKTGEDSRSGKYVFLTHSDGFVTFYCHCSEILVSEGMNINKGETIARVGSTGQSTGPHLHFEIRKDNIRLNPLWVLEDDC